MKNELISSSHALKDQVSAIVTHLLVSTPFEGNCYHTHKGGLFQIEISLSNDWPTNPPSARFSTKIFHPNVHPSTGEICVSTLKKDWNSKLTLNTLLQTIRCLLIAPNPESALNEEAGRLLLEEYDGTCLG